MASSSTGPAMEEEELKKKVSTSASVLRESSTRNPCPSGTYTSSSWSVDLCFMTQVFSICCFCAETRNKWVCGVSLCVSPSRAISVSHSLPALPYRRPLGFQSLAFLRGLSAWCRFLGLVAQCGVLTPCSQQGPLWLWGRSSLLVDHHPEDLGSDSTASLPLHCHYVALTLYFLVVKIFSLLVFRLFSEMLFYVWM